jgi:hypothetical protein
MCAVAHQEAPKEDAKEETSEDAEKDSLAAPAAGQVARSWITRLRR